MTTSIFIANNGPKAVHVLAFTHGSKPVLLVTLEPGQTTKPEHCHVFDGRDIVVTENKPDAALLAEPADDDETDITTSVSSDGPVGMLKQGDKF